MNNRFKWLYLFVFLYLSIHAQIKEKILTQEWPAQWIAPTGVSLTDYGVFHFRKTFNLENAPEKFVIHVSADNRYELFINGERIGMGPARGDAAHWRFETYDIASKLTAGKNCVAAVVWNFGEHKPWAQMSERTGFIVQGDDHQSSILNTDVSWKVYHNEAYSPTGKERGEPYQFIVVGPGDAVDGTQYPWGWQEVDYADSLWQTPRILGYGTPIQSQNTGIEWGLVPRNIPMMAKEKQPIQMIRRTENIEVNEEFLKGTGDCVIPANQSVSMLLDQTWLTCAYPELIVGEGTGSKITLVYSEALFDQNNQKGHRDEIANRRALGPYDVFMPDGGERRIFRPLWFRTYRYIQLEIETSDAPLILHQLYGITTGYPFEENAVFESNRFDLKEIWDVGWQTAQLCAGETYFDCPFYEQLQYVGDTRIQALISLYVSGDDRLMRNAIQQFYDSRIPEGLTESRYPSSIQQVIPPYSLFWIAMVYDYWMHRDDPAFIKQFIPAIQEIIRWHQQYVDETGMLGRTPYWPFVDWPIEWGWSNETHIGGIPEGASEGHSSILTLQLAYVLQMAEVLMAAFDEPEEAARYAGLSKSLTDQTYKYCWSQTRNQLADTPNQLIFSQHANVLAVLTNMVRGEDAQELMESVLTDEMLIQCTFYYRFYLTRALVKAGMADQYLSTLTPWLDMLEQGLTTFAERPDPTRSDCHAWSASPNYEFLATVCGIRPLTPGFKSVLIAPAMGNLKTIEAQMPHPNGDIVVQLQQKEGILNANIILPKGLTGEFRWHGVVRHLQGGAQKVVID